MIDIFFDQTVSVERLSEVEDTNKKEFTEHIASLACTIQPLSDSITGDLPGAFGKDWLLMCNTADILEGDRIISGSKEYRVQAVEQLSFLGDSHTEAIIRIFES